MFIFEVNDVDEYMYIHPVTLEKESETEKKVIPNTEGYKRSIAEFELADTLVIFESFRSILE